MARINLKTELEIALKEVGTIEPWYDKEVSAWVFENSLYPVRYAGDSPQEVIKNYPKYLEVFIEHRMKGRIDEVNERKTKGRGGSRMGAGRPKGSTKQPTKQVRLPEDVVEWIKVPGVLDTIRFLISSFPSSTKNIHRRGT